MRQPHHSFLKFFFVFLFIIAVIPSSAMGADVSLRWDANVPAPEGYRVFIRQEGQAYDYKNPIRQLEHETVCDLISLTEGVTYYFVVRAFEGDLESADSEEVSYTPAVVVPNQAPTAVAGSVQTVFENTRVTLDGSASTDVDGHLTDYRWDQIGGTDVAIDGYAAARAAFTAPPVGSVGETLTFRLTVSDDAGSSSSATVTVDVYDSTPTGSVNDGGSSGPAPIPIAFDEWTEPASDSPGSDGDPDDATDTGEPAPVVDPETGLGNAAPDAPVIYEPIQIDRVGLTPVLVSSAYFDLDGDRHHRSQWQIGTDETFSDLILDATSCVQLTAYAVGEMILESDAQYFWRVRFIDDRNGRSDWSAPSTFTTLAADGSDDANGDGVPDAQRVEDAVDVNRNGLSDIDEDNLMTINTVEGEATVGVETLSEGCTLMAVKSLPTAGLADQSVKMGFGLVGYKLYLAEGVRTATVKMHFSRQVPEDARLYKYTIDAGWTAYDDDEAPFAPDRMSVTMVLEDGGVGDEDGTPNGVIVDPIGIATVDAPPVTTDSATLSTGNGPYVRSDRSCFISAGIDERMFDKAAPSTLTRVAMLTMLVLGTIVAAVLRSDPRQFWRPDRRRPVRREDP